MKPKDKTTLNIINNYKKINKTTTKILDSYSQKNIFNKYTIKLPNNTIENSEIQNIYICPDANFFIITLKSSELENYLNAIKKDETIQILNTSSDEIITYRQVSNTSYFFTLKIYDFHQDVFVVKCQCKNSQSGYWEDIFVEILNSVEKI